MTFEAITPRFGEGVAAGKIRIFDTTLRDGEQAPGAGLTAAEKLEVARQLARLKVDVIEAGFPAATPSPKRGVMASNVMAASPRPVPSWPRPGPGRPRRRPA